MYHQVVIMTAARRYITRLVREAEELECEMVALVASPAPRRPSITRMILQRNKCLVVGILFLVVVATVVVATIIKEALETETSTPTQQQFAVVCQFIFRGALHPVNVNVTMCQTFTETLTDLHLHDVRGTIPTELGLLTQLTSLDLSGNQLNGTIPSALGKLTQLTALRLSGNQLNGTIPSTIGKFAESH